MCGPYCFVLWAIRKFPLNDPLDKDPFLAPPAGRRRSFPPADSPNKVAFLGSPPNSAAFARTHFKAACWSNQTAARPVLLPRSAYGPSMFDELGKFGGTAKEIGPDQVRSIKGTGCRGRSQW
jgi:hypothetical protein